MIGNAAGWKREAKACSDVHSWETVSKVHQKPLGVINRLCMCYIPNGGRKANQQKDQDAF